MISHYCVSSNISGKVSKPCVVACDELSRPSQVTVQLLGYFTLPGFFWAAGLYSYYCIVIFI